MRTGNAGSSTGRGKVDLCKKDDNEEIRGILAKLNNRPKGTFLQQVSAKVIANGGPPANELSREDLLSLPPWSKLYSLAAQNIVSDFLSGSEIFKELPDLVSLMWMADMSSKVLALAIDDNHRTDTTMITDHSDDSLTADNNHGTNISMTTSQTQRAEATDHDHHCDANMTSNLGHNASAINHKHYTTIMTADLSHTALAIDHDRGTDTIMTIDQGQDTLPLTTEHYPDALVINGAGQDGLASDVGNSTVARNLPSQDDQPECFEGPRIVILIEELIELRQYACEVNGKLIDDVYLMKNQTDPSIAKVTKPAFSSINGSSNTSANAIRGSIFPQISQNVTSRWQTVARQQTDMDKWESILNNDRKPKSKSTQNIADEAEASISASMPRVYGHVPTNSDCDRLAQKLEGWHMNLNTNDQQLRMKLAVSETPDQVQNIASAPIHVEIVPPARPLSYASRASTSTSQSMTDKLTTALKSPLTISPRLKTTVEATNTRLQEIEGQMNSVGIKTEAPATLDRCDLPAEQSRASAVQTMAVLIEKGQTKTATEAFMPTPRLGAAAISTAGRAAADGATLGHVAADSLDQNSDDVLSPNTRAAIENFRNGPGLSASRWASDENEFANPQQSFGQSTAGSSRRLNPAHAPVFQPTLPPIQSHFNLTEAQPNSVPLPTMASRPMASPQSGYVPLMATIITRDPYIGELREVEGMVKAGSVPALPHVPVPLEGSFRNQENIPMQPIPPGGFYNSPLPNFPPRPDHARYSSESSDSGGLFKPGIASNPLSPQGLRGNGRIPLSPVQNRANDIQSELQSRINSSLAGRHGGNSPAR